MRLVDRRDEGVIGPASASRKTCAVALEDLSQDRTDGIADVLGGGASAQVAAPNLEASDFLCVEHLLHSGLDGRGLGGQATGVAQHHGGGEDLGGGVDDALAGDVGGGAVDGLVDAVAAAAVGDAAEAGAGQDAQGADDAAGLVGEHVAKRVVGVDDAVEHARVLDHEHAEAVGELVLELDLGELAGKHLARHPPPQPARRQHVGLVARPHRRRARGALPVAPPVLAHGLCQRRRHPRALCDLVAAVRPRVAGKVVLLHLGAKVRAAAVLAEHHEVGPLGDARFQRRQWDQRARVERARPDVGKRIQVSAEAEEARLGIGIGCAPEFQGGSAYACSWKDRGGLVERRQ